MSNGIARVRTDLMVLAALIVCAAGQAARGEGTPTAERAALVNRLRHEEGQIRSATGQFEVIVSPTRPEMVRLIREYWRLQGKEHEAAAFVVTENRARANSRASNWWKSDVKERLEEASIQTPDRIRATVAFDGHIVRKLNTVTAVPHGEINSGTRDSWLSQSRTHPLYLTHVFQDIRHSDLIERGRDFHISSETVAGRPRTRVAVRHPTIDRYQFELVFDSECRLVERLFIAQIGAATKPDLREAHRFDEFRPVENASGATIWFPRRAVLSYYVGRLPNGTAAEWMKETVTIKDLKLNVDIPDDTFSLSFPPDAEVWDALTGQGFLGPGVRPYEVFAETGRPWWHWGVAVLFAVVLLTVVGAFVYRRRPVAS